MTDIIGKGNIISVTESPNLFAIDTGDVLLIKSAFRFILAFAFYYSGNKVASYRGTVTSDGYIDISTGYLKLTKV